MRNPPRQVERCAVLGPESRGETASSPSGLLVGRVANARGTSAGHGESSLCPDRSSHSPGDKPAASRTSLIRADRPSASRSEMCRQHFGTFCSRDDLERLDVLGPSFGKRTESGAFKTKASDERHSRNCRTNALLVFVTGSSNIPPARRSSHGGRLVTPLQHVFTLGPQKHRSRSKHKIKAPAPLKSIRCLALATTGPTRPEPPSPVPR